MSRRGRQNQVSTVAVSGRLIVSATQTLFVPVVMGLHPSFTALQGTLNLTGGAKLTALSDLYEYFRFTRVSLRALRTGADAFIDVGYQPDASIGLPATLADVIDMPWTGHVLHINANDNSIPSVPPVDSIPMDTLCNQNVRWWRTRASASVDDQFEYQGSLSFGSSTSGGALWYEMQYSVELRGFIGASLTPSQLSTTQCEPPAPGPVFCSREEQPTVPPIRYSQPAPSPAVLRRPR